MKRKVDEVKVFEIRFGGDLPVDINTENWKTKRHRRLVGQYSNMMCNDESDYFE